MRPQPRKSVIRQYELVEKVKKVDPHADEDLLNKAYVFCMKVHGQQLRASGDPYFFHPLAVAEILADMRLDGATIITALLHDTLEDTLTTYEEIETLFGADIAKMVEGVTKLSKLEHHSDKSFQAENFRKLFLAMSNDIRILLVKLADRVHNISTLHYIKDAPKRWRIAKETLEVYAPLASRIGITHFKDELENYAFEHLYPEEYKKILTRLEDMPQSQTFVENIISDISTVLEKGGLQPQIYGREKTPYSIWIKMKTRNIGFEQLADLMAFRVLVNTLEECYQALGLIHSAYVMVPGRFKDYISTPKANGYQSLHTTVIGPFNQKIEIQIRTRKMQEVCEFGVAAHWNYKQNSSLKGDKPHEGMQYKWIRNLLEILEHAENPDEFLEHTKLEMFRDQVFCFTPKGEVIALPKGASVLDFAYAIHGAIGDNAKSAKINGKSVPLRTELANGDQVEVVTSKQQKPCPTWEHFVVTGKAKAQIRKFVRTHKREQFLDLGRTLLTKALKKEGLKTDISILEKHITKLAYATVDDALIAIGEGRLSLKKILTLLTPRTPNVTKKIVDKKKRVNPKEPANNIELPLHGFIPGMAIHYAPCCHPLPGDFIVGIVNEGKGMTVHTRDCDTLKGIPAHTIFDLRWHDIQDNALFYSRLRIVFENITGALASVTAAISSKKGSIHNLKILNRSADFWEILVDVEVEDKEHLEAIQANLHTLPLVSKVRRE